MNALNARSIALALVAALIVPSPSIGQSKSARIGWLSAGSVDIDATLTDGLRRGLSTLGYTEGKGFVLVPRYTKGRPDELGEAARALIAAKVDVIVASGDQAALAAKQATSTVPIVVQVADATGTGLVPNLARPGANITGVSDLHAALVPKRLEILKELVPELSRAAFVSNPGNPTCVRQSAEIRAAAPLFGLVMQIVEVGGAEDVERAFGAIAKERAMGVIVCGDRMLSTHRARIHDVAARTRIPVMYANRRFVDSGGLMSYGTNLTEVYERLAVYIDRILKGARPGDLPIEQPTKFEVAVNLKAAQRIGITIPRSLLLRADHVVE